MIPAQLSRGSFARGSHTAKPPPCSQTETPRSKYWGAFRLRLSALCKHLPLERFPSRSTSKEMRSLCPFPYIPLLPPRMLTYKEVGCEPSKKTPDTIQTIAALARRSLGFRQQLPALLADIFHYPNKNFLAFLVCVPNLVGFLSIICLRVTAHGFQATLFRTQGN